jgi:hypothetical protein
MGLEINGLRALKYASKKLDTGFNFLMLGRQEFHIKQKYFPEIELMLPNLNLEKIYKERYIENLIRLLGAKTVDSIDFSDYEGATHVHDIGSELPEKFIKKYDCIFDGGTLEHVYNFPMAILNCMNMLTVGGYMVTVTMANNFCGHGLYQFSPELYYRIFSPENGFEVISLYLVENGGNTYRVIDPKISKRRANFKNSKETYMIVVARKHKDIVTKELKVLQSDYVILWERNEQNIFRTISLRIIRKIRHLLNIPDPSQFIKIPNTFDDVL